MAKAVCIALVSFVAGALSASTTISLFPMWLRYGVAVVLINLPAECEIPRP